MSSTHSTTSAIGPSNRLGLDYTAEAAGFGPPVTPIIDVHTHVGGTEAAALHKRAAELYGVKLTYSMTHLENVPTIRNVFGDAVRFIAVPNYAAADRRYHLGRGYIDRIKAFYEVGARIAKFWVPPRSTDFAIELGDPKAMRLDAPTRIEAMQAAQDLGMIFMVHVADPDTWFATKYADASVYGTKLQQYEPLERMLDRFTQPWIAAHLGGWPEDLQFLTELLTRHDNLYLDTSATKWMVREVSKHPREDVFQFLTRFKGRIMFGTDIVSSDDHLNVADDANEMTAKASSPAEAFDLYASRYWALRTLWERDYDGESPIADPDLAMVDPHAYGPMDAPPLRGKALPTDVLQSLYHDAAHDLLEPLYS
jgi:hypothetical protein